MFKTLANAWKIEELRKKLLFTVMIILLYRLGAAITVPFVHAQSISDFMSGGNGIYSLLRTLSSGFENGTLFALGVSPYITASIVIQLLTVAIPSLERLAKQGEEGKKKITAITRYITIGISLVTAIGYYFMIQSSVITNMEGSDANTWEKWFAAIVIIACFCAGSALVMWLAERINEKGIGNGISIILFANIVSRGVAVVKEYYIQIVNIANGNSYAGQFGDYGIELSGGSWSWSYSLPALIILLLTTVGILALIWFVVFISDSERRIPVQYAKKVVGRKMYGGRNTNLPLKVNMAGVMPVIFASSILSLPAMILGFINPTEGFWKGFYDFVSPNTWFYAIMTFILILAFAYFYVAISFNPTEVASNLQQNGGSIPGIRPGKPTSMYIKKVLSRVTFIGALALSVVAVLPVVIYLFLNALGSWTGVSGLTGGAMISEFINSGTSIIIVVGVVLETVRDLEAQMTMRHYKGFLN